jgi:hypothetical protein
MRLYKNIPGGVILLFAMMPLVSSVSAQPDNDNCEDGIIIDGSFSPYIEYGTTVDATLDCPGLLDWNAVWYEIIPPYYACELTIEMCGTEPLDSAGNILTLNCLCDGNAMIVADESGFYNDNTCYWMKFYGINALSEVFLPVYTDPPEDFELIALFEEVCPLPQTLFAYQIKQTSAIVQWNKFTADYSQIEYGPEGFTPTGIPMITDISDNYYPLTSLTPGTCYDVYIRNDCSYDWYSRWAGPMTFCTMCPAISTFPYTQNFDNQVTAGNTALSCIPSGSVRLSECWRNFRWWDDIDWSVSEVYEGTPAPNTGASFDHTTRYLGNGKFLFTSSYNCIYQSGNLDSPVFDLTVLPSASLSFWYHRLVDDITPMTVEVSTDLGTNWDNVWGITGSQGDEWKLATVNLDSYVAYDKVMFRFRVTTGASSISDVCLDDVSVQACAPPDGLDAASVTGTSAQLSWIENDYATSWDILIGPAGMFPSNTPTYSGVSNPYDISTLMPGTCYDYYVRAHCPEGHFSTWTGPFSFCTVCPEAFTQYPYYQDFNRLELPPRCWSAEVLNTNATWGLWLFGDLAHTDLLTGLPPDVASQDEWMISPVFDLTTITSPYLLFNWICSDYNLMVTEDLASVELHISLDGGSTWEGYYLWTEDEEIFSPYQWKQKIISLEDFSAETDFVLAFQYYGMNGAYFFIDNFIVASCEANSSWSGNNNDNWNNPWNWTNGVPCETTGATIPDVTLASGRYPVLINSSGIAQLSVSSPGAVRIMQRGLLEVTGTSKSYRNPDADQPGSGAGFEKLLRKIDFEKVENATAIDKKTKK